MSRKDYEAIAAVLRAEAESIQNSHPDRSHYFWRQGHRSAITRTARRLADIFQADNPRFDRERFLKACGL